MLGNHNGTDGLMMKDLPDIVIRQGVAGNHQEKLQRLFREDERT